MKEKSFEQEQLNLYKQRFVDQVTHKNPLYRFAEKLVQVSIELHGANAM